MSFVSSVLLQVSCAEESFHDEGPRPGLVAINDWLSQRNMLPIVELDELMCCGKHPQTYVFGGGYNHFPEDDFADFILGMKWDCPENVVLVINPEEGPTRIWRGDG